MIALILIILAGTKDKIQLMLLLQMFGSLLGLCLEHKIQIYFDLVFETGTNFKLLSLNILFSTSVYLLIIRDETGFFVNKIYTKFI